MKMKIYASSRTRFAPMWRDLRQNGFDIISTWIDEVEPVPIEKYAELSVRCIEEIKKCDIVVLYSEKDDILKGGIVEVGAALALGKPVRNVGNCVTISKVFRKHPLWTEYNNVIDALCLK